MCWFHWESISCWNSPGMTQQGAGGEKDSLDGWLLFLWDWLASIVEADMLSLRGEDRRGACLVRVDSTDVGGFLRWSRSTSAHWRSCGKWGRFVTWMSQLQTSWEAQRGWRIDGVRRTPLWPTTGVPGRSLGGVWSCCGWRRRAAVAGGGAFAACVPSVAPMLLALFLSLFLSLFMFVVCLRLRRRRRDRRLLFMYLRWSPL